MNQSEGSGLNTNQWPVLLDHFICSEDLDKGIRIERANMRGVYSKAMYEGGKQERALADQYRAWARAAQNWPRTAFILKEIASGWDSDAERSDIEAKKDMMKQ